jgi:hypothetical protein
MVGIAAAAVALGVTQLLAAFVGPRSDSRTAIGSSVIDSTPGPVKEWAITTFGTADKLVLTVLVLAVIAVIAAVAGSMERPRVPIGSAAIVLAGVAGCVAVLSRGGRLPLDIVPTVVGTVCGVVVLRVLTSGQFTDGPAAESAEPAESDEPDHGRRLSLVTLGLLTAGALTGVVGVVLSRARTSVAGDRDAFALPVVDVGAEPIPPTVQPKGVALPSFVTSNDDFYRIDTALSVPQLSRADWQLRIHGMVDREITYRFADLDRFEVVEKVVTLTCVSNPVGGNLISNASWTGYRVRDLLADAGAGRRDERQAAAHRPRLPRTPRRAGPVRVCVGHQMGRRPRVDAVRQGRGVLDAAGLVAARAHQDRVPHRRAAQRRGSRPRAGDLRRRGLGAEPRREGRRGAHR